jgi:hypothetical protein
MKTKLLFLLLCASISFNGWSQTPSITITSAIPTSTLIGTDLTVNYKYTVAAAGNIWCGINVYNGTTYVSYLGGKGLSPAVAGTDVTGTFNISIPNGTTPSANLPSPQKYYLKIELSNSTWSFLAGDYPVAALNLVTTLGVEDNSLDDELNVYPNPVADVLNITNSNNLSDASFSILNVSGQTVLKSTSVNNDGIDVSNLSSGVYILSIDSGDGGKQQFKFCKK